MRVRAKLSFRVMVHFGYVNGDWSVGAQGTGVGLGLGFW